MIPIDYKLDGKTVKNPLGLSGKNDQDKLEKLNNEIVNQISIYEDFNMVADLLTYDSNRNAIVYGSIYKYDSLEYVYFLVFINAKMEFIDFVIVENEYDYIGILKNFKIKNNWKE